MLSLRSFVSPLIESWKHFCAAVFEKESCSSSSTVWRQATSEPGTHSGSATSPSLSSGLHACSLASWFQSLCNTILFSSLFPSCGKTVLLSGFAHIVCWSKCLGFKSSQERECTDSGRDWSSGLPENCPWYSASACFLLMMFWNVLIGSPASRWWFFWWATWGGLARSWQQCCSCRTDSHRCRPCSKRAVRPLSGLTCERLDMNVSF